MPPAPPALSTELSLVVPLVPALPLLPLDPETLLPPLPLASEAPPAAVAPPLASRAPPPVAAAPAVPPLSDFGASSSVPSAQLTAGTVSARDRKSVAGVRRPMFAQSTIFRCRKAGG